MKEKKKMARRSTKLYVFSAMHWKYELYSICCWCRNTGYVEICKCVLFPALLFKAQNSKMEQIAEQISQNSNIRIIYLTQRFCLKCIPCHYNGKIIFLFKKRKWHFTLIREKTQKPTKWIINISSFWSPVLSESSASRSGFHSYWRFDL